MSLLHPINILWTVVIPRHLWMNYGGSRFTIRAVAELELMKASRRKRIRKRIDQDQRFIHEMAIHEDPFKYRHFMTSILH